MKVAAATLVILAIALAVVPMFTDCEASGRTLTLANGNEIPMKCHWTGQAELGLSLPLVGMAAMVGFSRRKETRRFLGIGGTILGAVAILLPTELIGVCMNPEMTCVSTMKPALILSGALVIGISVGIVVSAWGKEDELA